jgi:S1-C subfamily serine protease
VLGAGLAGAVIAHEMWSATANNAAGSSAGSTPPATSPSAGNPFAGLGFGNSGNGSSGSGSAGTGGSGTTTPSSGAVSTGSVSAKVDPGLVDVNSTFGYQSDAGAGTGIVVSSNGLVLTNNHVVNGATKISAVDVGNGQTYSATVLGYDPSHDLALLQLQGASGLRTAPLGNSSSAAVGNSVVAIGNAGGTGGTPTSASGTVTGVNQSITAGDELTGASEQLSGLLATNADVQPGDSGGPLVNAAGQVIGIDTAGSTTEGFVFQGSSGGQGYAIPINTALATAQQIEAGRASAELHVGPTGFLGVFGGGSTSSQTVPGFSGGGFSFGFGAGNGSNNGGGSSASGATISGVISGEPAQKAGLAAGDTITSLDGQSVGSWTTLGKLMLAHHPGDTIRLGWTDSSGNAHTTSIQLASGPPA